MGMELGWCRQGRGRELVVDTLGDGSSEDDEVDSHTLEKGTSDRSQREGRHYGRPRHLTDLSQESTFNQRQ